MVDLICQWGCFVTPDDKRSVTQFLKDFQGGDDAAFEAIWTRYFTRLVAMARRRLQKERRLAGADEEDIALSAFKSFHRRARRGDFPRLDDRDDLWVQLVTLTRQKIVDLRRRERALKRGRDRLVSEADTMQGLKAAAVADTCIRAGGDYWPGTGPRLQCDHDRGVPPAARSIGR